MDHGEMKTGTRDEHYDLVSVLYHAVHGADNCERYAHDAADPPGRAAGGRGEAREARTVAFATTARRTILPLNR